MIVEMFTRDGFFPLSFLHTLGISGNPFCMDSNVAVVALIVSLVALAITSGQLLGQYFATADGYRRCQPSVMGSWAKRTRLRWRWTQFRFETFFTIPEIILLPFMVDQQQRRMVGNYNYDFEWVTGSTQSQENTMVLLGHEDNKTDEIVCWLPLLAALHAHERQLQRLGCYNVPQSGIQQAGPAVRFRERSWDFMSPEIVRPHAITNVSDIAVLVRRLGMIWGDFRKIIVPKWCHFQLS